MMAKLKIMAAPLLMAGAAAGWIVAAPYALAEDYAAAAAGTAITHFSPQDQGGSGCANGTCGQGGPQGGNGCTPDGTCGNGGPQGGSGCTADGKCGYGGPQGGGGSVPGRS